MTKLISMAALLFSLLVGCAYAEPGDNAFDVGSLTSSADLVKSLRGLTTDQAQVIVDLPKDLSGQVQSLNLDAGSAKPPFHWEIMAFTNKSRETKNLVLSIDYQRFLGSKVIYPAVPGSVIQSVTQAGATPLLRMDGLGHDAFEFSLEPLATTTVAVLLKGDVTNATIWERHAYELQSKSAAFFRGAILGIALLLTLTMLILYTARTRIPFLSGGLFAIASVAFIALEAGYLPPSTKLFNTFTVAPAEARGVTEALMVVGLLLCLSALINLRRTMTMVWNAVVVVSILGLALAAYAFLDPLLVSTIARISFFVVALAGFFLLYAHGRKHAGANGLFEWCFVVAWAGFAAIVAFTNSASPAISPLLLLGLTVVLVLLSYRLAKGAGDGMLSQRLFQEAGRRGLALAGAQQYVWDWHPQDRELFLSEELEKALGHAPGVFSQGAADVLLEIMHPADRGAYLAALETAERRGRGFINREMRLQRADGSYRWFELRARAMPAADNTFVRGIGTLSDITNAKLAQERLIDNAIYDQVTGLPNRALFVDRLEREITRHRIESLHVLQVDLDRFKTLNDGLGHEAGDALLTLVARRIEALLGIDDTAARLPGDQFAILFTSQEGQPGIEQFAAEVRNAISQPVVVNVQEVFLTASIGVASYRHLGLTAQQMMKDVAVALYEAKRQPKSGVAFFHPAMQDNRGELVSLEAELRRALERNEIEVHYQPIARLSDMDLAGFEALVRWRHPVLGMLAPESFLGLAEQTGMIKDIGRFVLNEATRQLGIWQRAFRPGDPVFMAVNVSSSQLLDTDIVADISAALVREAVYRQTLKIEVTESIVMQFPDKVAGLLERIKQHGVGLACDDFGTGYSSLSCLRTLPFDTLKIDRSFIGPDVEDERAAIILQSIITLAHDLDMSIVVEGISDQAQVDRLGAQGVDFGQGFFIGQPLSAKQISESLGGLPYVKGREKTAISTLWERATREPELALRDGELSSAAIEEAVAQRQRALAAERQAAAALAERVAEAPPPGSSPMAPRPSKQEPIELPSIFPPKPVPVARKPAKAKPAKKTRKKPVKTARPKATASGVAGVQR